MEYDKHANNAARKYGKNHNGPTSIKIGIMKKELVVKSNELLRKISDFEGLIEQIEHFEKASKKRKIKDSTVLIQGSGTDLDSFFSIKIPAHFGNQKLFEPFINMERIKDEAEYQLILLNAEFEAL